MAEPALPEEVAQDLRRRLLEPFDDEASAKAFWDKTSSTLIILDHFDSIEGSEACRQIEITLTYPEYTSISRKRK